MSKAVLGLISFLLMLSCQMKTDPGIRSGIDECENCTMIIQDIDQGAVAIDSEEELHTFCNPVCLIKEFDKLKKAGSTPSWKSYLFDHSDDSPIPVSTAFIVQGDFPTAMGHGLLAFHSREAAEKFTEEIAGEIVSWNTLRIDHESADVAVKLAPEDVKDPQNYEAMRGEIVYVYFDNNLDSEETVTLTGYDFEVTAKPQTSGQRVFVADKPGQGFAFRMPDGSVLGMLFVGGDHTTEEAVYR